MLCGYSQFPDYSTIKIRIVGAGASDLREVRAGAIAIPPRYTSAQTRHL